MKTNATPKELQKALKLTNKKYKGNICFNRFDPGNFTLKVNDSSGPGHRLGFSRKNNGDRRKLASACWHVHGNFFEALFKVRKDAWIRTGGRKIDINGGNWEDRNIGSNYDPLYFSEACECN